MTAAGCASPPARAGHWQVPTEIKSLEMLTIAVIGLVVNGIVAFVLGGHNHDHKESPHEQEDINVKSAFLHVRGDVVSSVGVILAALIIWKTGWQWVYALTSVLIGIIILLSSWRILKSSLQILAEGVPEGITLAEVGQVMATIPGVTGVHDLHIWNICSGHVALSAHVVTTDQPLSESEGLMAEHKRRLNAFGIEHTTIQFECDKCGQGLAIHLESQPEM